MSTATAGQIVGIILSAAAFAVLVVAIAWIVAGAIGSAVHAHRTRRDRLHTGRDPKKENV